MNAAINSERVIASLEEWASESDQRRLWLSNGADGAEISSFIEVREQLFTDTGLGDALDRKHTVFGEVIDGMLRGFDALLSKIDANRAPEQIIEDSRMEQVRLAATEVLGLLRESTSDQN